MKIKIYYKNKVERTYEGTDYKETKDFYIFKYKGTTMRIPKILVDKVEAVKK